MNEITGSGVGTIAVNESSGIPKAKESRFYDGSLSPRRTAELERAAFACRARTRWPESESSLELVIIYEDARTMTWTTLVTDSVVRSVGKDAVHIARWNSGSFSAGGVLAEAVLATSRADLIVIALCAAEELPWEFHVWVDAWLPRRLQITGALLGLIGVSEGVEKYCRRTVDYLSAVARRGDLDFFTQQCDLSVEDFFAGCRPIASGAKQVDAYDHWGLNE